MGQIKPTRADQLSPEKAEAILEGGMQEFLAHGYAATSMDRVAIGYRKQRFTAIFKIKKACYGADPTLG